jgi:hypothetical protein
VKSQGTGIVYGDKETRKQKKGDMESGRQGRKSPWSWLVIVLGEKTCSWTEGDTTSHSSSFLVKVTTS